MRHMNTPRPRVRCTVPVAEETLQAFQHYAEMGGISVGKAMGEWLDKQVSAVIWAALKFEEVHEIPREIADQVSRPAVGAGSPGHGPTAENGSSPPRPVIRGGKSRKGELK